MTVLHVLRPTLSHLLRATTLALGICALATPLAPAHASPLDWISGGRIVQGSGKLQQQTREVASFNGLAMNLPGQVTLRLGERESVSIEADDNLLPLIDTVVENGTLRIRGSKRNTSLRSSKLKIVVTARQVERISVGGSGNVEARGLHGDKLRFDVGGSGSITATELDSGALAVSIGGSGSFHGSGKTQQLTASIGGSGQIEAGRLAANTVQVSIGGSGAADVWASDALSVNIGGSGEVRYVGDPALSRSIQGSGGVRRLGPAPR